MADKIKAVVLAAGRSTRMKSDHSKVLHRILGREIIRYLLDSLSECGIPEEDIVIVAGDNRGEIEKAVGGSGSLRPAAGAAGHGPRPVERRGAGLGARGRSPGAGRGQSLRQRRRIAEADRPPPPEAGPVARSSARFFPAPPPYGRVVRDARGAGTAASWRKRTPAPSSGRSAK